MKKAERLGPELHGAGYGVRTRDLNLGKVARYYTGRATPAQASFRTQMKKS